MIGKKLSEFLIYTSGHSPALSADVNQAEKIRLEAMAWTLLLPVSIAGLGSYATAYQVSDGNQWGSLIFGILIGIFTLIVDRALLASSTNQKGTVCLRISLTLISSSVFAHSLLLWVFQGKLDSIGRTEKVKVISSMQENLIEWQTKRSQPRRLAMQSLENQSLELRKLVQQIERQIAEKRDQLATFQHAYDDEVGGRGGTRTPGIGPESKRILEQQINPLAEQIKDLENEVSQYRKELLTLQVTVRKQQSGPIEKDVDQTSAESHLSELTDETMAEDDRDLLSRVCLLHQLIQQDKAALVAYLLLSSLFLLWELLPLLLKMASHDSEYQRKHRMLSHREQVEKDIDQTTIEQRAEMQSQHELRLELMRIERLEIEAWSQQVEDRFQAVQAKRSAIPKRATPEQREAYLSALEVLMTSLVRTGHQLNQSEKIETDKL